MHLSDKVRFSVGGMRITSYLFPMMLLGADILKGGRKYLGWNYVGCELEDGQTSVGGNLPSHHEGITEKVPLHHAPAAAAAKVAASTVG